MIERRNGAISKEREREGKNDSQRVDSEGRGWSWEQRGEKWRLDEQRTASRLARSRWLRITRIWSRTTCVKTRRTGLGRMCRNR